MLAGSKRICVVNLLASLTILLSSILAVHPQDPPIQQAPPVSITRLVPKLDVTPVAVAQKQIQPSRAVTQAPPATPRPAPIVQKASAEAAPPTPALPAGLLCIRGPWPSSRLPWGESNADYSVHDRRYSGAYQYDDPTWGRFMGYVRAWLAPAWVQDLRALLDYNLGPQHRHQLWPHTSYACGV